MTVPTKDYSLQYREIWDEVRDAIERTMLTDDPILGSTVDEFETDLARYHSVAHAIGVGCGTDALVLLLRQLGIGREDEVITCAHTFSGVVSAVLLAGAKPVLCDADERTGLLDAAAVANVITARTKAVLAVHLYGHPVDLDALASLCSARRLLLIEDAAQAHGALWCKRPVGSFGKAAILSFHPSKNLGAFGDGGAVLTSDAELASRLRVARNLGKRDKYAFSCVSPNSKLDTLQAAILRVKLRRLDTWVERRRSLAQRYCDGLQGVGDLVLPQEHARARHAYHLFVVQTSQRDPLRAFLRTRGIATSLHYPISAARQPALQPHFESRFPVAEKLADRVLTLPLSHEHDVHQIDHVVSTVKDFFAKR
jgi:dTDP-4-amino-4,6-dideoxygalactose transaminase